MQGKTGRSIAVEMMGGTDVMARSGSRQNRAEGSRELNQKPLLHGRHQLARIAQLTNSIVSDKRVFKVQIAQTNTAEPDHPQWLDHLQQEDRRPRQGRLQPVQGLIDN